MLVLSRRLNEKILIGDDIKVTVIRVDRQTVRIGIEAPLNVPVLREELCQEGDGKMYRRNNDNADSKETQP